MKTTYYNYASNLPSRFVQNKILQDVIIQHSTTSSTSTKNSYKMVFTQKRVCRIRLQVETGDDHSEAR